MLYALADCSSGIQILGKRIVEKLSVVQRVQLASLTVVDAHVQIQEQRLSEATKRFEEAIEILEGVTKEDADYASLLKSLKEEYAAIVNRMGRIQN